MFIQVDSNSRVSISKEAKEALSPQKQQEAEEAAALCNKIYADLAAAGGDFPKPGTRPSTGPTQSAQKHCRNGVDQMKKSSPDLNEAIKLFNKAIDTVLARPYFESMQLTMAELCQCLGPRCDAYIASKQFAKAYADATLLTLLSPRDAANYFRKAVTLYEGGIMDQAVIYFEYAVGMAPDNKAFAAMLEKAKNS